MHTNFLRPLHHVHQLMTVYLEGAKTFHLVTLTEKPKQNDLLLRRWNLQSSTRISFMKVPFRAKFAWQSKQRHLTALKQRRDIKLTNKLVRNTSEMSTTEYPPNMNDIWKSASIWTHRTETQINLQRSARNGLRHIQASHRLVRTVRRKSREVVPWKTAR